MGIEESANDFSEERNQQRSGTVPMDDASAEPVTASTKQRRKDFNVNAIDASVAAAAAIRNDTSARNLEARKAVVGPCVAE